MQAILSLLHAFCTRATRPRANGIIGSSLAYKMLNVNYRQMHANAYECTRTHTDTHGRIWTQTDAYGCICLHMPAHACTNNHLWSPVEAVVSAEEDEEEAGAVPMEQAPIERLKDRTWMEKREGGRERERGGEIERTNRTDS